MQEDLNLTSTFLLPPSRRPQAMTPVPSWDLQDHALGLCIQIRTDHRTWLPSHPGWEFSFHAGTWDLLVYEARSASARPWYILSTVSVCWLQVGVEVLYTRPGSRVARSLQSSENCDDNLPFARWQQPTIFSASRTVFILEKINIPKAFWDHFATAHFKCLHSSFPAWEFHQYENPPVDCTFSLPIHFVNNFNLLYTPITPVKLSKS